MKRTFDFLMLSFLITMSCSNVNSQTRHALTALEFRQKINDLPGVTLIDVRTPDEFSKGHLPKSQNINWNDQNFMRQISSVDKNKPVLVYCLSGGRSGAAAEKMRAEGFKEVYEMEGGMMKWRAAKLPEEGNKHLSTGMTVQEFQALLKSDKLVLVDFYADWCAPCQKMAPYLKELETEMADKVVIVRINADENQLLAQSLHVDALPKLLLYNKQQVTWEHSGYITKEDVVLKLK